VGVGFGTAARLRTTLGASGVGSATTAASLEGGVALAAGGTMTRDARGGLEASIGAGAGGAGAGAGVWLAAVALTAFTVLAALVASSGWTWRRRPSASARRRMRSAWASSIEAEGLEAPMPSFWASASNSLLVIPSSLESSCTRIFFCAKTFP
jgi:hypothetical protein